MRRTKSIQQHRQTRTVRSARWGPLGRHWLARRHRLGRHWLARLLGRHWLARLLGRHWPALLPLRLLAPHSPLSQMPWLARLELTIAEDGLRQDGYGSIAEDGDDCDDGD